ncbi:CHASE3 domain-containing protein [Paenibacillus sp. sgz5001063]|uniref:CHASE3 domain-containing protein n=1 Tax=Paenibacillus sp. sgz5001063 TaxID=3242474 RepID=UPI0036D2599E
MLDERGISLKIRGKIALGYAMILLMLGLFLLVVSSRITDLEKETVFLSDHDMKVHELTYQIEKNMLDMETGQRGYALTGDPGYLPPFDKGTAEWEINYTKLRRMIENNPDQMLILQDIQVNINKWIGTAGRYVVDLKRNGQTEAVNAFFRNDSGKMIIDSTRSQLEYFRDNERQLTSERIANLKDSNDKLMITMYALWTMVALLAALVTYLISASIVNPLQHVIQAIQSIASGGNMSERIRVKTRDEIYELGNATNELLDNVQRDHWSSGQISLMSMALQETTDLSIVCRTFMNRLSFMLEMQYGVIYVLGENELYERMYSYAGSEKLKLEIGKTKIHAGEGLIGQCAIDKKLILLEDLPEDYISVHSGLGRSAPKFAVIAPVIFENKTVAVLEAASLTQWAPYQLKLFDELLTMLGVTLNSVLTRMEIQHLYKESQVLNEELQIQSEELQVQSEELQVQTEELQNQTHELLIINRELEDQKSVAENAAVQLEKYNEQLEQSSRYKSEFLANMSHELRTPLNSMLILSQLLTENRNETLTEEEQGYAAVIHSSGSALLEMINDILDLSKVEAGKMTVERDAVNLTELPSILNGYFIKTAEQKNIDFQVILQDDAPDLFFTDEMRLHQILRNLLSNAFKFTEQGFVKVVIHRVESFTPPHLHTGEPAIAFTVKDSGIGVSDANRESIFEAFRQADGSTVRKYGGTGLGLSISQQLARLLGGTITLDSKEGVGSTFTLYLPCREIDDGFDSMVPDVWSTQAAAASEWSELQHEKSVKKDRTQFDKDYSKLREKTVLIVDDDIRNIYALDKGLEPYDMNILTTQSGFECLQIVREQPDIDIVLLDIMMPNLDGYDTLSIIREELQLPELPVIAISAKTMKDDREKCLAAGASDFLSKPVVIQDVVTRMCRLLEGRA